MQLLQSNIVQGAGGYRPPSVDASVSSTLGAAVSEGFERSVTGTAVRAGLYTYLRHTDETKLTKEQYEQSYIGAFDYDPEMSLSEAQRRLYDHVEDAMRQTRMGHQNPATALAGTLAGSILSPDLVLFGFLPEVKFAHWASQTGKTGLALARSQAKPLSALRASEDIVNASLNAGLQNAALEPVVYALDNEVIGREHGLDEAFLNVMMGFGLGVPIGGARTFWRAANPDTRTLLAQAQVNAAEGRPNSPEVQQAFDEFAAQQRERAQQTQRAAREFDLPEDMSLMESGQALEGTGYHVPEDSPRRGAWERMSRWIRRTARDRDAEIRQAREDDPRPAAARAARIARLKKTARNAANDDENLLNDTFKTLFGTEVKFLDADVSNEVGVLGIYNAGDPTTIYVRAGSLDGKGVNMLRIAGHEMGHAIRARDPRLWMRIVDTMLDPKINHLFDPAYREVRSAKKRTGQWNDLLFREKMDETFATVLGHAMQEPAFWRTIYGKDKEVGNVLAGYIVKLRDLVTRTPAANHAFEAQLAKAVSALDESGEYKFKTRQAAVDAWHRHLYVDKLTRPANGRDPFIATAYANPNRQATFRQMEAKVLREITFEMRAQDREFRKLDDLISSMAQSWENVQGRLQDKSAVPAKDSQIKVRVEKRVLHADADPRRYAVQAFYRHLKDPRAREGLAWLLSLKRTGKQPDNRHYRLVEERGPLVTWKKIGEPLNDGSQEYEFTLLNDDNNPFWSEIRPDEKALEADDPKPSVIAEYQELFDEVFEAIHGHPWPLAQGAALIEDSVGPLYSEFYRQLDIEDLAEMRFDDFMGAFRTFLEGKMDAALRAADDKVYRPIVKIYNDLQGRYRKVELKESERKPGTEGGRYSNEGDARDPENQSRIEEDPFKELRDNFPRIVGDAVKQFERDNPGVKWRWFDETENFESFRIIGDVADGKDLVATLKALRAEMFDEFSSKMFAHLEGDTKALHLLSATKDNPEVKARMRRVIEEAVDEAIFKENSELREALLRDPVSRAHLKRVFGDEIDAMISGGRADELPITNTGEMGYDGASGRAAANSDEAMEASFDEAMRTAKQNVRDRRRELDAAADRAIKALETEAEDLRAWINNTPAEARKLLPQVLKRNGLGAFEPDEEKFLEGLRQAAEQGLPKPKEPQLTKAQQDLMNRLKQERRDVSALKRDAQNIAGFQKREDDLPSDFAWNKFMYHLNQTNSRKLALERTIFDIEDEGHANMVKHVLDHEAKGRLESRGRQNAATMLSWLDGMGRRESKFEGVSLAAQVAAAADQDLAALHLVLEKHGLSQEWASGRLAQLAVHHLETGKMPDGRPTPLPVKEVAETLRLLGETQVGRINSLGGRYRLLDGFAFHQVHDAGVIVNRRAEWEQFLHQNLDWERVQKMVGLRSLDDKARQAYVDGVYQVLTDPEQIDGLDLSVDGGNWASRSGQRRTLLFQPGAAFEYDGLFGSGNTAQHIEAGIQRRATAFVLMQEVGPSYKQNMADALTSLGVHLSSPTSDIADVRRGFNQLTGVYDTPENVSLAMNAHALRQMANFGGLWQAGIASAIDIPGSVSTLRWMGYKPADLHARVIGRIKQLATDKKGRAALEAQGAALSAILQARRTIDSRHANWFHKLADKASRTVVKYSGLDVSTRTYQYAFIDLATQHLGDMARARKLPEEFVTWLRNYGISEDQFRAMAQFAGKLDGLDGFRLAPDMIPDRELSRKLRGALRDSMSYAQLQPSITNEAHLRLGTRAGTWFGETIRMLAHWKSYPLAMITKQRGRLMHLHGEKGSMFMPGGDGRYEMVNWAAQALAMSFLVLAIRDVLRGEEPMNPFEADHWNFNNLGRIVTQAGVGPFAAIDQFSNPSQALGPVFGNAYKAATAKTTYAKTEAFFRNVPIVPTSLAPADEVRKRMTGFMLGDAYMQGLENSKLFKRSRSGQDALLDFTTD